ncbi:c-type cytochrome [Janthinobacterium sp. HLX7-2]|uniref:c-type cytochrome n=1 Tax=Janthinobacterium sp. HLX7-2 TaxID=1259331 RepID=UPI003F25A32F
MTSKKCLAGAAGIVVLGLAGAFGYAMLSTSTRAIAPVAADGELAALIDTGRYVATAADCIACHTAPGGKPFAGALAMATPIGTLYSTNITPDKQYGIGNYSLNDFDRAVRHGMTPQGGTLYPAMPYPSYARMTDDDVRALYAYFMQGVAAVPTANRDSDIAWPLSIRWPLAIWRKTFAPAVPDAPLMLSKYQNGAIARGAYLVQSLGHCGSCHTPRAATLQELALDDGDPRYLSGGPVIDGWLAVNLRGDQAAGLGRWSEQDIVDTLRGARNARYAVLGSPMAEVVKHSTQHLTEPDLQAVAAYLKTLPAAASEPGSYRASNDTALALKAGREEGRGAQLYLDNCAACHRSDGVSNAKVFPALAGNPSVLAGNPTSLIRVILAGSTLPSTQSAPSNLGMPGFAWRMTDEEVAQLATFVRHSWGNQAPAATASEVASVRKAVLHEAAKPAKVELVTAS